LLFEKDYELTSETAIQRFRIFKENLKKIREVNSMNLGYTYGINQFSDLTPEEFKERHLINPEVMRNQMSTFTNEIENTPSEGMSHAIEDGFEHKHLHASDDGFDQETPSTSNVNSSTTGARAAVDWKPYFNVVRHQGNCGSCWAFATNGAIEANYALTFPAKARINLSPQQLVDCDKVNFGCGGGWYEGSMTYIKKNGIVEEKDYKYTGVAGACSVPAMAKGYKITRYENCNDCTIDQFYAKIAKGPVAIVIDATDFMNYKNGILIPRTCTEPNHAVVAIGWGSDNSGEIIVIRNSWGNTWGEQGYVRVRVNLQNKTCLATLYAFLPLF
jgi:C1A family cysteine protease